MNVYSVIILCFIPFVAVFILLKILINDINVIKELLACAIGLLAVIPVTFFQFFLGEWFSINNANFLFLLMRALILYGLIEEGIKCATLFLFPSKKIDSRLMFWYSILAGLFLGSFESVIYVLKAIQSSSSRGELLVNMIYIRTFTSIVIHTFCAGLGGLFAFCAKKKRMLWGAIMNAVLIHGLYDFFAIMPSPFNYFSYVIIVLLLLQCRIYYVRAKTE